MDEAVAWILMASVMAAFLGGVESKARVCYFGPPPEPDPDNPDHWMKQVMQEIRERCPGKKERTSVTPECLIPKALGLEDGSITDGQISSSGALDAYPAQNARLNDDLAWLPSGANPWIEVDLIESKVVSGLITQGWYFGYVTTYKVAYKKQPSSGYEHVTDVNGDVMVFIGNTDTHTPVTNLFDESVVATVMRIEPTERNIIAALRFELLGCHD
ncbi:lactadherin-like [Patiria miniata]|uniref:F5/8 type C domain-containing protein n=1 Tax=Patiria miniata TaxID=46514 RepID=A0A914BN02_PATMI|nr:lactadherin-like [Patiria miniata]